jgi:NAD(P)H-dependent FMN reductase
MQIVVLNGSPKKAELSVTMQYMNYIKNNYPEVDFIYHNVGVQIRKLERDRSLFDNIMQDIKHCDGLIYAFPLYFLHVPSQFKRFIELIFETGSESIFKDKPCTSLSTSVHFYDQIPHYYMQAISEDLGCRYLDGFSASMNDIFSRKYRNQMLIFGKRFFYFINSANGIRDEGMIFWKMINPRFPELRYLVDIDLSKCIKP